MEHAKHIIRAVLLLVTAVVVFVLVRHFLYPKSFGLHGHYRFDSVAEYASAVPVHGGNASCAACHEEQAGTLTRGKHASISCEVCHAPLSAHVQEEARVAPMPVDRSMQLCATCHQKLVARPKEFPQVVLPDHAVEKGAQIISGVCQECHHAHNPSE